MARNTAEAILASLLPEWLQLLQSWAVDGRLSAAAQEALILNGEPAPLKALLSQWSAADFSNLPPIVLLSASDMNGAMGAYAISTGTIYLNADWLTTANTEDVHAVLSEELGHHLDGLLNALDTPGDEGEIFSGLLNNRSSTEQATSLRQQADGGSIQLNHQTVAVEQAATALLISTPIAASIPGRTDREFRNPCAFAALRRDGSVVTWGDPSWGGDSTGVDFDGPSNNLTIQQIFSNFGAFAALRSNGSVVTWGIAEWGGNSSNVDFNGANDDLIIQRIFSNRYAFAALRSDGSLISWGEPSYGGNSSSVDFNGANDNLKIIQVVSTDTAFTALRSDGTVVSWGDLYYGGDSSGVDFDGANDDLTVQKVFATGGAFAALRSDGSVVSWGANTSGISWIPSMGGNSSGVDFDGASDNLTVQQIFSTNSAFAALRSDGSVVTWGNGPTGGNSSGVDLDGANNTLTVQQIVSTNDAFAALRSDGSVVSWGASNAGGDSSGVDFDGPSNNLKVQQIFSNPSAFAALRSDGSIVTWGHASYGGNSTSVDFNGANDNLTVTQVVSSEWAFAALRSDGSVVSWGSGANSSGIDFNGSNDDLTVEQIFSNGNAFAALRSDGSVVTWGHPSFGGNSSAVASQLTNVVAFANPFADDRLLFAPTNLTPSTTAFNENISAGSTVASLATTDPDAADTFTYALVAGSGDSDNAAFSITGNSLTIKASPDFEVQPSYTIRVRSTDQAGLFTEKNLTFSVNDLVESRKLAIAPALTAQIGRVVAIPITLNDASNLEAFDLTLSYALRCSASPAQAPW